MSPVVFALPGAEALATDIAGRLGAMRGELDTRTFPDQERYFRLLSPVKGRDILFVAYLDDPDPKMLSVLMLAEGFRQHGARSVTLVAPYLPYMRQDAEFNPGEIVTARVFAKLVSTAFDGLVTIDPHLHRFNHLGELYEIPTLCLSSATVLARWIEDHAKAPFLIGPDQESEQWVSQIADLIQAPYQTLTKTRRGDRDVDISLPDLAGLQDHTIVLIDDIISSGATIRKTLSLLTGAHLDLDILCCATHGLASEDVIQSLRDLGVRSIATTLTVPGAVSDIPIGELIASELPAFLAKT
ncbi:MAG: ribose-phosphate diphosphokinase [Henriciella sp.]|nr:ribose-phosphate diphosphokinase [Henriciella sp.]